MLLIFEGELAARDTLRFAEEKAGFGLWQLKFETNELTCSPNSLRLLGLPSDNRRETDDRLTFASIESVAHPNYATSWRRVSRLIASSELSIATVAFVHSQSTAKCSSTVTAEGREPSVF